MRLKIFRCRYCGAKVSWKDTSCKVCNHLVSNDRAKRNIAIGGACIVLLAVILVIFVAVK